ncbi:hypothetical protein AAC387_Pa03g3966 [Persea americana]
MQETGLAGAREEVQGLALEIGWDTTVDYKEHEQERRIGRKLGVDGDCDKDLVDILLDISEDEKAEMKLTRDNIKAFVPVRSSLSRPDALQP